MYKHTLLSHIYNAVVYILDSQYNGEPISFTKTCFFSEKLFTLYKMWTFRQVVFYFKELSRFSIVF